MYEGSDIVVPCQRPKSFDDHGETVLASVEQHKVAVNVKLKFSTKMIGIVFMDW